MSPSVPAGERAYLDHAATTILRPEAREAYLEASQVAGNPSSMHTAGRRARAVLDRALEQIADLLGVPVSWLILTSGGTEADHLALRAVPLGLRADDPARDVVAVANTDHPAVLATARSLGSGEGGIAVRELPVDAVGRVREDAAQGALADGRVGVLSAALVNNETGAVQDLAALSTLAREHGTLLHSDAVQAVGHVDLPAPGTVDLMSLSGHKIGAPVGVGALVARPEVPFAPLSTGGGQQRGVRSGTLDAASAAAFAAALQAALDGPEAHRAHLAALTERLLAGVRDIDPSARLTLPDPTTRSGHIVHLLFPGADAESLLFLLDERGVDASAGSACSAGVTRISPVLEAMEVPEAEARGALRLSLGWSSTAAEVEQLLSALPEALRRSRAVAAFKA